MIYPYQSISSSQPASEGGSNSGMKSSIKIQVPVGNKNQFRRRDSDQQGESHFS